jgi:hypothetical protein
MVKYILWARIIQDPKALNATTLAHQYGQARQWAEEQTPILELGPFYDFTMATSDNAHGLHGRNPVLEDYRLADLGEGVRHWPQDEDEGMLTRAIQLARRTNDPALLSEYEQFVDDHWGELYELYPALPTIHDNHDQDAAARVDDNADVQRHAKAIRWRRV